MDFDTLSARALNSASLSHKPAYIGVRLLLAPAAKCQLALERFLNRRCAKRMNWRFHPYLTVKESRRGTPPVYRSCISGSPLTTLVEARVLGLMASDPAFAVPKCAYSHNWPAGRSGRNFSYFLDGYLDRNKRVASRLLARPNRVAVVSDIRRFYPSVDRSRLRDKMIARTAQVQVAEKKEIIERFALSLLDMPRSVYEGIPIGPDIGHPFGHIILEKPDKVMMENHGDDYHRFVDDVVLVCDPHCVNPALARLKTAIDGEGLQLNEEKTEVVGAQDWQNCLDVAPGRLVVSFESLLEQIACFLVRFPHKVESLTLALRSEGFSLPIQRIAAMSRSKRYRGFLNWALRRRGRSLVGVIASLFGHSELHLVSRARAVRSSLLSYWDQLAQALVPASGMARRWFIQKRRCVVNRLMYLMTTSDYGRLATAINQFEEFNEAWTVLDALHSGDATAILALPGKAVGTFAQLWSEQQGSRVPRISWPTSPGRAEAETMAHLSFYLSIRAPESFRAALELGDPDGCTLLDLCERGATERNVAEFSFLDEVKLLYSGRPHDDTRCLVASRFDEVEDYGLEGLSLGGLGFPSSWPFLGSLP